MAVFDVGGDAKKAFDVLLRGGVAIVPHTVGYAALGGSGQALRRIFGAKKRGASKRNAMIANLAIQNDIHQCSQRGRDIVHAIVDDYNLPFGCIAPYRPDHPMLKKLDAEMLTASTQNGTIAMLLNAGLFHAEHTRLSQEATFPLLGSSANLSLKGTKFKVEDIEPEIVAVADIVVDHGLQSFHHYRESSTLLNVETLEVTRFGCCYADIAYILKRHFRIELPPTPPKL